jgi:hypothetical protein
VLTLASDWAEVVSIIESVSKKSWPDEDSSYLADAATIMILGAFGYISNSQVVALGGPGTWPAPDPNDPMSPKGDGIYRLGENMAPGLWYSDGSADNCYWQISPIGSSDIIDNHFGSAGGSVTLQAGQQFETRNCGNWTHQG